tara:strand:+ start:251 stop:475 length:225 start_codon:yes stop_codon:yes gene_type:complete
MDKITEGVSKATGIGIQLISLAIILQIVFGHSVGFLGGNVIGVLLTIVHQISEAGLVGLVTLVILWKLFQKNLK